jgi:plastocyanin
VVSCGGGSDSSPTSPTPPTSGGGTPVETNTITISSAGVVSPMAIRVALGSTVTMVNNDSRSHDMNSDPHPAHTDCPAIDWGLLQPGQNRQSGALTIARTCGYHDHSQPTNTSLQGTIQVQ